jgi:lipoprotein-releasing system permease protein
MSRTAAVNGTAAGPFSRWERQVAGRYLRTKRQNGGVALISSISFIGITLAVAVLIIVMSVMNGFRTELLGRILGFNGHAYVGGAVLSSPERDTVIARIRAVPGVVEAAPMIEAQAMVIGQGQITGAIVRGMTRDDLMRVKIITGNIKGGSLAGFGLGDYGGDEVLIGDRLAASMGVKAGDAITLISPTGGATAFGGTPRRKVYTVGAIFSIGMSEYDQSFLYMPLQQAQLFFGREGAIDVIEVKLANPDSLSTLKPLLNEAAGPDALVTDWRDRNQSFFNALQVERIVAIAAMNIISGLIMLVKNKGRDIAILRTMGAGQGAILRIFFMAGASIGAAGTLAGLIIGVLFCTYIAQIQQFVEWITGTAVFSADVYFLAHIPAKIDWPEVASVTFWSLLMSVLATLPPAWRASRLDPVEGLRYE